MRRLLPLALLVVACSATPRGPEAFAGESLRSETLDNGVQYEVLAEGEGEPARESDRVELHYTLYLEDGTKIDDSHDGKPMTFLILEDHELIEGIQHGVLGMREKELRRVWVPPKLGYQDRRVGKIPAKSKLRFDVELMKLFPNPY